LLVSIRSLSVEITSLLSIVRILRREASGATRRRGLP